MGAQHKSEQQFGASGVYVGLRAIVPVRDPDLIPQTFGIDPDLIPSKKTRDPEAFRDLVGISACKSFRSRDQKK
jgi:hypothetical protein